MEKIKQIKEKNTSILEKGDEKYDTTQLVNTAWCTFNNCQSYKNMYQGWKNLPLLARPIGHAKNGRAKPNWTSDRDTTRNTAFCSLLHK